MATEHQLIALLEGCLTCAPQLHNMPIGAKVRAAVERFNQAQALGFDSTAAMDDHAAWLKKNGTAEYQAWLASIPTPDKLSGASHG